MFCQISFVSYKFNVLYIICLTLAYLTLVLKFCQGKIEC
jgi:hypothetical protein